LGMLSDLLPGLGSPAQAAVFASIFLYLNATKFLALTSSIAVSHTVFSLIAISSFGKARTGATVAISEALGEITIEQTAWLVGITVLSAALSVLALLLVSRRIAKFLSNAPVREMGLAIFAFLAALVFIVDGPIGLLFMGTSAAIGVIPPMIGVRRTHLMGAILVPSIISLAGLTGIFLSLAMG
jgi:putative membrane protein